MVEVNKVNPFGFTPSESANKPESPKQDGLQKFSLFSSEEKAEKQASLNNALNNRNSIFE